MKALYEKHTQRKDINVFHNFPDDRCFPVLDSIDDSASFSIRPVKSSIYRRLYEYLHKSSIEDIVSSLPPCMNKVIQLRWIFTVRDTLKVFWIVKSVRITHHGMVMPLETKYQIMENADACNPLFIWSKETMIINILFHLNWPNCSQRLNQSFIMVPWTWSMNFKRNWFIHYRDKEIGELT